MQVAYLMADVSDVQTNDLKEIDPQLAVHLSRQWEYNILVYQDITYYLLKTSQLPGFSDSLFPCTPVDEELILLTKSAHQPRWLDALQSAVSDCGEEMKEDVMDDSQDNAMVDLVETFSRLE